MVRVSDKPLPGDYVIRSRAIEGTPRRQDVWVLTRWPDAETVVAGPYQSYSYALRQAAKSAKTEARIWRDHARLGDSEQLELVGSGVAAL